MEEQLHNDHNLDDQWGKLLVSAKKAVDEINRLSEVIRQTHTRYCSPSWTDRGLHAPECLIHELDEIDEPSRDHCHLCEESQRRISQLEAERRDLQRFALWARLQKNNGVL